jgi:hypothetical protein
VAVATSRNSAEGPHDINRIADVLLRSWESEDAELLARTAMSACGSVGWADPLQPRLLSAVLVHVFGFETDLDTLEPITVAEVAAAVPDHRRRRQLIDLMVSLEVICNPIPQALSDSVDAWAAGLGVDDDDALLVAREFAAGEVARATADFVRSTYSDIDDAQRTELDRRLELFGERAYYFTVEEDPEIAGRYLALERCAPGTLGRALWDFYVERGFLFPGQVGAANPELAQHDWGHVLYGYGTTGIGEVQAAAFKAASSEFHGVDLQFFGTLMIYQSALLTSYVTGTHPRGEMEVPDAECRVADAIRRGRVCTLDPFAPGLDFFDHVDEDIDELRERWNIVPAAVGLDCACVVCARRAGATAEDAMAAGALVEDSRQG